MTTANQAAANGDLELLKSIRENGGEWTSDTADWAAKNGHLEVVKWIRENGGGGPSIQQTMLQ